MEHEGEEEEGEQEAHEADALTTWSSWQTEKGKRKKRERWHIVVLRSDVSVFCAYFLPHFLRQYEISRLLPSTDRVFAVTQARSTNSRNVRLLVGINAQFLTVRLLSQSDCILKCQDISLTALLRMLLGYRATKERHPVPLWCKLSPCPVAQRFDNFSGQVFSASRNRRYKYLRVKQKEKKKQHYWWKRTENLVLLTEDI